MSYSDQCERWAAEGLSGSEASHYASSGQRPDYGPPESEDEASNEDSYTRYMIEEQPYCQLPYCMWPSFGVYRPHQEDQIVLCKTHYEEFVNLI